MQGNHENQPHKHKGCHDGALESLWYRNRHQTSSDSQVRTHATPTRSRTITPTLSPRREPPSNSRPQHQVFREISQPICGGNNLDSHPQDSRNFLDFISRPIITVKSLGEALHHRRHHTHNPSLCSWLQTSSKLQRRNLKQWRARKSSVRFPTLFTNSCQEAGSHAGTTGFLFKSGSMTPNLCLVSITSKLF